MNDIVPVNEFLPQTIERYQIVADTLSKYLKANTELTVSIQGKKYVTVEGWQFSASQLGYSPIIEYCRKIEVEGEIKYEAKANLVSLATGNNIASGFAICSNKEHKKRSFEEYAVASMAQTRAVGKACRLAMAFLIKQAGFEATPYEEVKDYEKPKADTDFVGTAKLNQLISFLHEKNPERPLEQIKNMLRIYAETVANKQPKTWNAEDLEACYIYFAFGGTDELLQS